ncbi:hypothetical protein FRC17_008195 [Serendipita sp. 399]|nr:hypothetical protein FRC17_008195 [Serendipita sp. 399]
MSSSIRSFHPISPPRSSSKAKQHNTANSSSPQNLDDEDYVVVASDGEADNGAFRPSIGGESMAFSDMGESHQSHDALLKSPSYALPPPPSQTFETIADEQRLPLTVNKLNPVERAALVRQTRKLHKILGTAPQIAEAQPLPTRTTSNRLQRRPTLAGSDVRLDRSAALATLESPKFEPPPTSNWGKIASSLVATSSPSNVNAPVLKLNVVPSPVADRRARRLSDSSVASSLLSAPGAHRAAPAAPYPTTDDRSRMTIDGSSSSRPSDNVTYRPVSPTSPDPRLELVQKQQTRARMAKLQQIMGESVPSELVLNTQARDPRRRRLSMESPSTETPAKVQALKHKRSRSMWRKEEVAFDSAPESSSTQKTGKSKSKSETMPSIEDLLYKQLQIPQSDKQRALNVKRALKMAAVFGVPPPPAIYQDRIPLQPTRSFDSVASRQSLASLRYMLDHDRDSLYDLLASTADSGSEDEGDPLEWPYEHRNSQSSERKSSESNDGVGSTKMTVVGRYPDMAPPTPVFGQSLEQNQNHSPKPAPPTKPTGSRPSPLVIYASKSVSSTNIQSDQKAKNVPPALKSPSKDREFAARRRRANKLSKFFGVGYQDLFTSMVYEAEDQFPADSPPVPPLPASARGSRTNAPSATNIRANLTVPGMQGVPVTGNPKSGTVLVQTDKGKATVLRTSTNLAADIDADDLENVMSRLRALKA